MSGSRSAIHDALHVGEGDVFRPQTHRDQQIHAGERRGARAGGDQPDVRQLLALQQQAVADGGGDDDRGAVLIVMEDRDFHPLTEPALDREALGRLDVLEVDGAKGWLEGGDDLDEAVRVLGVHLDVEDVDAGELLEQDGLALHDRLAG